MNRILIILFICSVVWGNDRTNLNFGFKALDFDMHQESDISITIRQEDMNSISEERSCWEVRYLHSF